LPSDYIGGGAGLGASSKSGGSEQPENEWVLKPNTDYVIQITNNGTAQTGVNINLFWYEH